ncbi:MAG: hypothetical protein PVH29_03430 [Candidatus Zixiibacteriota bacterium]|jgi:hypothetical protein
MSRCIVAATLVAAAAFAAWQSPVNLGAVVNSAYGDWYPVLTPHGDYMFFVSSRPGGYGNGDIWCSANIGGVWQAPVNCGAAVNSAGLDTGIALNLAGTRLYFASDAAGTLGDLDVWYAPVTGGTLGAKVHLPAPVNSVYRECCPVIGPGGDDVYFSSEKPGGQGGHDMYVSSWTGSGWSEPVSLGAPNSAYNECPRWISDDGLMLAYLSWRPEGEGGCDLWYTTKTGDTWSEGVNFGAPINSAGNEFGPWFHCNHGQMHGFMYFGSSREGGHGDFDIWYSEDGEFHAVDATSLGGAKAAFR